MGWYQSLWDLTWCRYHEEEIVGQLLNDGWEPFSTQGDVLYFKRIMEHNVKRKDETKRLGKKYV